MKKALLFVLALVLAPSAAIAAKFEEGKHYKVINEKATANKELVEFFSFYCPHCFKFEPTFNEIKSKLNKDIKVRKAHVTFISWVDKDIQQDLSRALAVAQGLKVGDKVIPAIFNHIHVKRAKFANRDDIRKIFVANGVDGVKFDMAMDSFGVSSQVKKMEKDMKTAKVSGVPYVMVNGKYQVLGGVSSAAEYAELVDYLASKD